MSENITLTPFEKAAIAASTAESKKALDTAVLDTGKISTLADYFVVCSGESKSQIKAIADAIAHRLKEFDLTPLGQERDQSAKWFLIDYGDVVIHVMNRKERDYYQLEQYWNHADVISRDEWSHEDEERQVS